MNVYGLERVQRPEAPPGAEDHTGQTHFVPAPCQVACPVGTDAPSYIAYIWEGKLEQAYEAITSTNPFSSICGRVCDAPCEPACRRTVSDGAVQIRNLKRYVMDAVGHRYDPPSVPVSKKETIAVVGSGPAGLVAAHDLSVAGYEVHVYEMTDRLGGMMIWGIPAFRLPPGIIQEDIDRLTYRCAGLNIHLNTELGKDVSLKELTDRHDAVLLTIGSWWGKAMNIPGEDDPRVIDGVSFLRRINNGERPKMPETVIVVGGGDVAMDACRSALRLPGCREVKVVYRRGPEEIPAREIELHHALKEGIEIIYNTQQIGVESKSGGLALKCLKTEPGELDEDGRSRPVVVEGSKHDIACGLVIAAVGQLSESDHLGDLGLMASDRVQTDWASMRTAVPKVFAAGDGAFGGSTIVMAMSHGQRAAYYIKAYLDGRDDPLPYRTPYRTRRVEVAQDLAWETNDLEEPHFFGIGDRPIEFPEIEATYDFDAAKKEAARCYRCDAETGSADYSIAHREDLFSMARTHPRDKAKLKAMLDKRLRMRPNPFPERRPATMDDLTFLPANLSRLVIDPYREACKISTRLAGKFELDVPFFAAGFDHETSAVREGLAAGLADAGCGYAGQIRLSDAIDWIQLIGASDAPDPNAAAWIFVQGDRFEPVDLKMPPEGLLRGLAITTPDILEDAVNYVLESGFELLMLCGNGDPLSPWLELKGPPDLRLIRNTIAILRKLKKEEAVDLIWHGGARSGTDAAKLIAMGCRAVTYGLPLALALGASITANGIEFASDFNHEERRRATANILQAHAGEASMMARCTGKTRLHNLEPEDLRSVTIATAQASGIPMPGTSR
ncbi:MAG: FAD-dependent oxidoreductase [Pseudomonadota bacterium]|nr:FAD-dependent oxidoreductase [Pseudomonadota bacterium]